MVSKQNVIKIKDYAVIQISQHQHILNAMYARIFDTVLQLLFIILIIHYYLR